MPIVSPALARSKMSGIYRGLLALCHKDQASGRQKEFCNRNKEVDEVGLVKVTKGKRETALERSSGGHR